MIKPGELIPAIQVRRVDDHGTSFVDSAKWLNVGTTLFFCVPGAFTPTCHNDHLPGFVAHADALRACGVDNIVCATVNDAFVVTAWALDRGALGIIDFLADFDAAMAKALGLAHENSNSGLRIRYKRSVLIAKNGVIQRIFVDEKPGQVTKTGASPILAMLRDQNATSIA